jgi:hypothetical protein
MKLRNSMVNRITSALVLLFLCCFQATSARSIISEKENLELNDSALQNQHDMKQNAIFALTLIALLAFGFQAAVAQSDKLDSGAEDILHQIAAFRKILESGESYYPDGPPAHPWSKRATSKEERERFYTRWEPTPYTKKKFDEALDEIAKLLNDKNRAGKEELSVAVKFQLDEIVRIQTEVERFDPAEHDFIVNSSEGEWLLRAVSMREREKWAKSFFKPGIGGKKEFWQKLDALATSGSKKIPMFKPNQTSFAYHDAAEEAMMKAKLGNVKIHQIGLANKIWEISKNEHDIPINRYKRGYVWAKNASDDYNYCHLYQVNIIRDYTGGGKYGSSYAQFLGDWLAACP